MTVGNWGNKDTDQLAIQESDRYLSVCGYSNTGLHTQVWRVKQRSSNATVPRSRAVLQERLDSYFSVHLLPRVGPC